MVVQRRDISTGGFTDADITSHLMHVQCESFHCVAKGHVDSGEKEHTTYSHWSRTEMCVQCHDKNHSPVFEIEKYWLHVKHK